MEGAIGNMLLTAIQQVYSIVFENHSSDEEDEDELINLSLQRLHRQLNNRRNKPSRIKLFVEETVLRSSDKEFQSHFRVTRQAFAQILELVAPHLENINVVGRPTIEPTKQLLATMWLLATPDSYRSVGNRFDMGKSSLFACFYRVIKVLNHIAPKIISWPRGDKIREIEQEFQTMARMRGVIGAVDGTYIPIKAPQENPEVYINRKCFYGVTLQAICDSKRIFTDCYVGWPSSVSDSRIFKNSDIYRSCNHNPDLYFDGEQYIIGDKAYPITTWCIPPYIDRRNLQPYQVHFNQAHAKTRQIIERAFALLFGRFRRLRFLDMNRMDLLPATIIACCVLHNVCLINPDNLLQLYEEEGRPFVHGDENEMEQEVNINRNRDEAVNSRERLARDLINRHQR